MEFGLKDSTSSKCTGVSSYVSILVVMEFGLKAAGMWIRRGHLNKVSILVVMEFGLKEAIIATAIASAALFQSLL